MNVLADVYLNPGDDTAWSVTSDAAQVRLHLGADVVIHWTGADNHARAARMLRSAATLIETYEGGGL